jgi:hypothetical protein
MHRNNGCFFIIVHALSKNEPPPRLNSRAGKDRRCYKTSAKKAVRSWLKSVEKSSRSTANLLQKQEKSIESQLEPQLKAHLQAE